MAERVNFADCYVLANQRTADFIQNFLNHFIPHRAPYAIEYEVPQHAEKPVHIFTADTDLITYLEQHPNEIHAIYWENKELSDIKAAMCLYTSDGHVILGLTCQTHFPDTATEKKYIQQLKNYAQSTYSLIEYDTPAAKDTTEFLQRIKAQAIK